MVDSKKLTKYLNNLRRHLAPHLRPGIGIAAKVYPATSGGAVIVLHLGSGIENDDTISEAYETVNAALKEIPQSAFGGNLDGFRFEGTNVVMELGRVIMIKGGDKPVRWDDQAAQDDVLMIASGRRTKVR